MNLHSILLVTLIVNSLIVVRMATQGQGLISNPLLNGLIISPPIFLLVDEIVQHVGRLFRLENRRTRQVTDQPMRQDNKVFGDVLRLDILQDEHRAIHIGQVRQRLLHVVPLGQCEGIGIQPRIVLDLGDIPVQQWQDLRTIQPKQTAISQDDNITFSGGKGVHKLRVVVDLGADFADTGGVDKAQALSGDAFHLGAHVVDTVLQHSLQLGIGVLFLEQLLALLEVLLEELVEHMLELTF